MNKENEFTIIVDSREQTPFKYVVSEKGTLKTGDYSIKGYEEEVSIERKSVADICSTILRDRDRFRREMERSKEFKYFAIVIEGTQNDIEKHLAAQWKISRNKGKYFTTKQLIGQKLTVMNTIYHWSVKFRCPVFLCKDKKEAKEVTRQLLRAYNKYKIRGEIK